MDVVSPVEPEAGPRPRYSVVVPVWEEGENMGPLCGRMRELLPPDYEVLFCYDRPEDSTRVAFESLGPAERPQRVRWILNRLGRGARYAVEAGFREAKAPVVLVSMADLSDDYDRVEEMVSRIEAGADVVCASRYMPGGRQVGGPWLKSTLSRLGGVTLHWLSGLPTRDATNSFKAYRRDFLDRVRIESRRGFCFSLELTVKAHVLGGRVEEVPATWTERTSGTSRFQVLRWLPEYLSWYLWAIVRRWGRLRQASARR